MFYLSVSYEPIIQIGITIISLMLNKEIFPYLGKFQEEQESCQHTQYEQSRQDEDENYLLLDKQLSLNDQLSLPKINTKKQQLIAQQKKISFQSTSIKLPQIQDRQKEKFTMVNDKNFICSNLADMKQGDKQQLIDNSLAQEYETFKSQPQSNEPILPTIPIKQDLHNQQEQKAVQNLLPGSKQKIFDQISNQTKLFANELQTITSFDSISKSQTIIFQDLENTSAFQNSFYYQNHKIILTSPVVSLNSQCRFRVQNIKYCIGFGIALKQVIIKHEYDYQSQGPSQLGHGLYIVTSQGYSWSHTEKEEDDILRSGFNNLYNGLEIAVRLTGEQLQFKWKKGSFSLHIPQRIRQKYTLCYCAYLHEKQDAISISI